MAKYNQLTSLLFETLTIVICYVLMCCPVTFDDGEPNAGFARLTLTVPEMVVKKPLLGVLGSAKPQNAEITSSFDNG